MKRFPELLFAGRYVQAAEYVRRELSKNPHHAPARLALSIALRHQGKLDEAWPEVHRALELMPDFAFAWSEVGFLHDAEDNIDEARKAYRRAIELEPRLFAARLGLARNLDRTGETEAALAEAEIACAIEPDNYMAQDLRGVLLGKAERLEEAKKAFLMANTLLPTWSQPVYHLGVVEERRENFEAAERYIRHAIELEPLNPDYRNALRLAMRRADHVWFPTHNLLRRQLRFKGRQPDHFIAHRGHSIPTIVVSSPGQLLGMCKAILKSGTPTHPCYLRGQSQDWMVDGEMSIQPARFRSVHSTEALTSAIGAWRAVLSRWLGPLAEGGDDHLLERQPSLASSGHMLDLMYQPELAGTMQHYGFPTDFVDVTLSPEVALWFALHETRRRTEREPIRYARKQWSKADPLDRWPVVYAIAPMRMQVIDLNDGCLTRAKSKRVERQQACLVSTVRFEQPNLYPERFGRFRTIIRPSIHQGVFFDIPVAFKLAPGDSWDQCSPRSQRWYFPREDTLYSDLLEARVPFLARYHKYEVSKGRARQASSA